MKAASASRSCGGMVRPSLVAATECRPGNAPIPWPSDNAPRRRSVRARRPDRDRCGFWRRPARAAACHRRRPDARLGLGQKPPALARGSTSASNRSPGEIAARQRRLRGPARRHRIERRDSRETARSARRRAVVTSPPKIVNNGALPRRRRTPRASRAACRGGTVTR